MSLILKNDWNYVGDDVWNWEVYIVGDNPAELKDVKKVKYILHSTFPKPIQIIDNRTDGFRLKTRGWGTFLIRAYVYLKNGDKLNLKHELVLEYDPPSGTSA